MAEQGLHSISFIGGSVPDGQSHGHTGQQLTVNSKKARLTPKTRFLA